MSEIDLKLVKMHFEMNGSEETGRPLKIISYEGIFFTIRIWEYQWDVVKDDNKPQSNRNRKQI